MNGLTILRLVLRIVLGGMFLYVGITKAMDPVSFLKILRAYEMTSSPLLLNLNAALLPWLEILCGLYLLGGFLMRGAALVVLAMLLVFTAAITWRALGIHGSEDLAFCAIHFDCGCGLGDVAVCGKLLQNAALIAGAAFLLVAGKRTTATKAAGCASAEEKPCAHGISG